VVFSDFLAQSRMAERPRLNKTAMLRSGKNEIPFFAGSLGVRPIKSKR